MGGGKSSLKKKDTKEDRPDNTSLLESYQIKSQEVVDKLRIFRTDKNVDKNVRVEKQEFVRAG